MPSVNQVNQLGRPVLDLQTMLRELSYYDSTLLRLIPDGVFGPETLEAVMKFQRTARLPVTGTVDNATWDAVVLAYTGASSRLRLPMRTNGFPDRLYTISPGESSLFLMMIQSMLNALVHILDGIEPVSPNGRHTMPSVSNIRWLQRLGGLEETGIVGKHEWNLLVRIYEVFLIRAIVP